MRVRVISDLHLECLDEPDELEYIENMKQKYYKMYFKMLKEQ